MTLTLRQFNNGLSLVVVLICLYIIMAPFWPKVAYQIQDVPELVTSAEKGEEPEKIPTENTLVIPSMKLQQVLYEGGEEALNKGIWHMPGSGSPETGGNMVLSGHRFTYGGPAVLYHMDKVKSGDKIIVYWQKQRYEYQVSRVFVVAPTAVEIQKPTEDPLLTIYTCTPLITAANRLVVQAKPVEGKL